MVLDSEKRDLALLVAIAAVVGGVAIGISLLVPALLEGDLVVADYRATLHEDGTFVEVFSYEVKAGGKYRMLYRYWDAPLSTAPLDVPHVRLTGMDVPAGTVGYVKDRLGEVTLHGSGNPAHAMFVGERAERNEVGIYNPSYFPRGTYTVTYRYVLSPPVEHDARDAHLNLRLVDRHVPFRNVEVRVPARYAREVFPHPPGLSVSRDGGAVVVAGSVAGDEVLGIEVLFPAGEMGGIPGFPVPVDDVAGKIRAANPAYDIIPLLAATTLRALSVLSVVAMPVVLVLLYARYGREREFTVPEYLSFTPNPGMKPWAVNLLFKGDPMTFDQDGFYATLLDLHRRGFITVKEKPGGKDIEISVHSKAGADEYEQKVLSFLKEVGVGGKVDTEFVRELAGRATRDPSVEKLLLKYQRDLTMVTRKTDPRLIAAYVVDGRDHVIPLLLVAIALCAVSVVVLVAVPVLAHLLVPAAVLFGASVVQAGIALAFPSTLFGHWKDDRYREKLEWDAFARFLSDLALIRQYAPADLSMWGEWLVYGTALGVGDRVERAMRELHVPLPEAGVPLASGLSAAFVPVLAFSPPSRGGGAGGFGGGSFGGGGGFGGGGVGGR
ncbi:MAG: DUF2207 domain-containing protein [Methanolinea sp.]|nr:DUF2207 domain-containing protein [Methanolinea sp.]